MNLDSYYCENVQSILNEHVNFSMTDLKGNIVKASESFFKETGYTKEEVIGKTHSFLRIKNSSNVLYDEMWVKITKNETWKGKINNVRKNGEEYWVSSTIQAIFEGSFKLGYLSIRQDITKEIYCESLSLIDELTGANNRRKFNLELNDYLINYYRYKDNFSIVMIDIDFFKNFNDRYGHLVGDEVLKRMCNVMKDNIRDGDFFARWGGEEFVLILNKIDKSVALNACSTLLNKVRLDLPSFLFNNFSIDTTLTCSMGITSPTISDSAELILARADTALYKAKKNGRNRAEIL